MSPQVLDRSVRGALLVAVMMSLTAACAPLSPAVRALADQGEASVLIRNGFVVPTGQLLRVDDMSHLMTRDGAGYRAVASFAHSPEFDSFIRSRLFTPGRETVAGRTG